jgi:hypothetical protein
MTDCFLPVFVGNVQACCSTEPEAIVWAANADDRTELAEPPSQGFLLTMLKEVERARVQEFFITEGTEQEHRLFPPPRGDCRRVAKATPSFSPLHSFTHPKYKKEPTDDDPKTTKTENERPSICWKGKGRAWKKQTKKSPDKRVSYKAAAHETNRY